MSSTAASRLIFIATLALPLLVTTPSRAAQKESEAVVVAKLYKDYAWQAIATQPDLFGEGLAGASKLQLEKYFSPQIAQLLVADSACQERTREICNLDFDLLFDSQDPRVADLEVKRLGIGKVEVVFKDPASDNETHIQFKLSLQQGQWRIVDIIYAGHPKQSLKAILSHPIAR